MKKIKLFLIISCRFEMNCILLNIYTKVIQKIKKKNYDLIMNSNYNNIIYTNRFFLVNGVQ